jgi:putative endonuclease
MECKMYYVYILLSQKDGKLYIGSTSDLNKRKIKHDNGFVLATKYRRPLKLIYYEKYLSEHDAKRREIFFKGGKGHEELKSQLRDTFKKIKYKYR